MRKHLSRASGDAYAAGLTVKNFFVFSKNALKTIENNFIIMYTRLVGAKICGFWKIFTIKW